MYITFLLLEARDKKLMNTAWFLLFFFNALVQKPLGFCLIDSDTLLVIDRFMVIIIFVEREQLRITPITWLFRLVCAYGVEYFVLWNNVNNCKNAQIMLSQEVLVGEHFKLITRRLQDLVPFEHKRLTSADRWALLEIDS